METPNLTIDLVDLKILFLKTRFAYKGYTFESWCVECKKSYLEYFNGRENPKTYSQWVNGQIIALN